jgi:translocation and assembly module TamB
MTQETRARKWRWLRHLAWLLGSTTFLVIAGFIIFFGSGAANPLIRQFIVRRLEAMTGGRVELRTISIRWLSLQATLTGLVVHGREPAGTEPLFAADKVRAGVRIDSFWGHKVSLNELFVERPQVHIRVETNGSTNIPPPRTVSNKPLRERLFDLHIRRLLLENGWVLYNNVRTPLAIEGDELRLALDAGGSLDRPLYLGTFDWQRVSFTAKRFIPVTMSFSAKFTLWREGFALEQGVLNAAHSHIDMQAELQDFLHPKWTFRYRGWLNLLDIRDTFRSPETPTGLADVHGEGSYADGQLHAAGSYSSREINLNYRPIFRATGLSSRGSYVIDNNGLVVPDFVAKAFDGTVKGKVTLQFAGLKFRATTRLQDVRLAQVLPAIEHRGFPVDELHWDSLISADSVETWTGPFRHFEVSAKMHWASPGTPAVSHIPVDGDWQIRYRYDPQILDVDYGEFETPSSRAYVSGTLAPRNTAMDVRFETGSLENYRDFINAIQGVPPDAPGGIKNLAGSASWNGKITGPAGGPTFSGYVSGERVRYDAFSFDSVDGELTYSPTILSFTRGHVRSGEMRADIEMSVALTKWSFLPENTWSADVNFEKSPLSGIMQVFRWSYPASGELSGQFHGRGTRAEPTLTGLFDLANGTIYDFSFNRVRGQLNLTREEVRVAKTELRIFAPGKENGRGAGIVTGSAGYRFADHSISADLVGASLPLENFGKIQSPRIPVGGQLSFRLKANGSAKAPQGEGTFRVVDLKIGQAVIGSFDGGLSSDGHTAKLELGSAMTSGRISGQYTLGLAEPYRLDGQITIQNIDLDPFLLAALHLGQVSVHGNADGNIAAHGDLKHPESIVVDANFSRLVLNYVKVQLENVGPVHFRSSRELLHIDPATFRGTDTNVQIDGSVHFAGARDLSFRMNGAVDLRLIASFVSGLQMGGSAQVNASFEGTLDRPRVTGRIHVEDASARVSDFPTGLSAIHGDLIFDAARLHSENLTAQVGGGTLRLSGSLNYSDRPLHYEINARSENVRIRYPEGMSWLAGGSLRLAGTTTSAVLSGQVMVERVTLTQGLEVAGMFVSSDQGIYAPSTNSAFLRNLQFDIEATSTPETRMEWPGAQLEAEANLRVRGTWEHPILLGHIHVLSGDLIFHGNRYRVARGDINFANPFRLDPVINVEATTTIQQYEITLNFNGPASKLTLAYRSDPPLPANDIVTLLALGQTSSEATVRSGGTTGTSGTAGASALLSEAVTSQLGGRLEKLFGITRFRVDPGLTSVGSTGSNQNAAARVTVEQQVTRNLTVTYVSNVGSTQQQVIQVEFNLSRNVSIVALRDYNGTFGIDVKIKKRFP